MDNEVMKLTWIGTHGRGGKKVCDVSVSTGLISNAVSRPYVSFIFRNGSWKFFTDTDFMLVARFKNRIFFKTGDKSDGILLSKNKNTTAETRYARVQRANVNEQFAIYDGDYELKYDEFYELYYIEREDKE